MEAMSDEKNPKVQVISHNQSGGITAQKVIINNVSANPAPILQGKGIFSNQPHNGKFLTRLEFSLITPHPVGNLYLEVRAQTIEEMDCLPMRSGGWMEGHSGKREGFIFTNIPNAFGNYQIDIITTQPDEIQVIYNIE